MVYHGLSWFIIIESYTILILFLLMCAFGGMHHFPGSISGGFKVIRGLDEEISFLKPFFQERQHQFHTWSAVKRWIFMCIRKHAEKQTSNKHYRDLVSDYQNRMVFGEYVKVACLEYVLMKIQITGNSPTDH